MSFLCIGHRGASGHAPENTLKAFELAINMGCTWIELDVYCVDGELVVIHDDDVDRTTNGRGAVMSLGFEALRQLDAGDGERIPTLQEVLDLCDRRISINVELKGPDTARAVSHVLNSALNDGWHQDQFLLSSFNHKELAKADAKFQRGALFYKSADYISQAQSLDATAINLSHKLVTEAIVLEAHDQSLKVLIYTVNTRKEMQALKDMGVDGVFTNFPELFPADPSIADASTGDKSSGDESR
ncbi:MAG: glycerophosphoryl diester phosphodiesterase [Candidatus Azotimanducaceae bacterium]|jgi:glycerophosphoryl diester phosphodiesterase